jgi:cell fate (sporulation/competence/biofilm development) regulator YmcA (YheA/YmcA/DUF963 family)
MQILVFKTNLTNANRIREVESSLDIHPHIYKWNVDLNDTDNILRVVTNDVAPKEIEELVLSAGYWCEELD